LILSLEAYVIEYVIPENPDDRILQKASSLLNQGGLVAFPTDTNWIAVCDPFVKKGVEKLYSLKNEGKLKHYSVLCDSLSRASEVAVIHNSAFRLLKKKIPGHYTFIFEAKKKITKAVQSSKTDHEIGIRFPPSILVNRLIETHDNLLMGTQLDKEFFGLNEGEEIYGYQVEEMAANRIELILDPGETEFVGSSTIINLKEDGQPELLREGVGEWP
jgi:tRNA threonylcarbamoyl adenosine modification protein (Sua5/YciO/YrdC/YwlC family)